MSVRVIPLTMIVMLILHMAVVLDTQRSLHLILNTKMDDLRIIVSIMEQALISIIETLQCVEQVRMVLPEV